MYNSIPVAASSFDINRAGSRVVPSFRPVWGTMSTRRGLPKAPWGLVGSAPCVCPSMTLVGRGYRRHRRRAGARMMADGRISAVMGRIQKDVNRYCRNKGRSATGGPDARRRLKSRHHELSKTPSIDLNGRVLPPEWGHAIHLSGNPSGKYFSSFRAKTPIFAHP